MTDKPNTLRLATYRTKAAGVCAATRARSGVGLGLSASAAIVHDSRDVQVFAADGTLVAACNNSKRVLETASPPTFYLPPGALNVTLEAVDGTSYCEWKGQAEYFQYQGHRLAWRYPKPTRFAEVAGWYSFYPAECRCVVAGQTVRAQAGGFYGRMGDG